MHLYLWVILIALLFGLGLVLKRTWLAQQATEEQPNEDEPSTPGEQSRLTQLTNSVLERVQALRNGLAGKEQDTAVAQFREWAAHAFGREPEIQQWLSLLTNDQIMALTTHLREFCHDMGFELNWVWENQSSPNATLIEGLSEIVRLYSRASYQAVHLQGEVQLFRIYADFVQNPQSYANRELGEHLFGKLVEQGKSSVKISEHLAASTPKRQQHILDTIQEAADTDPQAFTVILKSVLAERTMAEVNGQATDSTGTNPVNVATPA